MNQHHRRYAVLMSTTDGKLCSWAPQTVRCPHEHSRRYAVLMSHTPLSMSIKVRKSWYIIIIIIIIMSRITFKALNAASSKYKLSVKKWKKVESYWSSFWGYIVLPTFPVIKKSPSPFCSIKVWCWDSDGGTNNGSSASPLSYLLPLLWMYLWMNVPLKVW